jgi:hypothetical protein
MLLVLACFSKALFTSALGSEILSTAWFVGTPLPILTVAAALLPLHTSCFGVQGTNARTRLHPDHGWDIFGKEEDDEQVRSRSAVVLNFRQQFSDALRAALIADWCHQL